MKKILLLSTLCVGFVFLTGGAKLSPNYDSNINAQRELRIQSTNAIVENLETAKNDLRTELDLIVSEKSEEYKDKDLQNLKAALAHEEITAEEAQEDFIQGTANTNARLAQMEQSYNDILNPIDEAIMFLSRLSQIEQDEIDRGNK